MSSQEGCEGCSKATHCEPRGDGSVFEEIEVVIGGAVVSAAAEKLTTKSSVVSALPTRLSRGIISFLVVEAAYSMVIHGQWADLNMVIRTLQAILIKARILGAVYDS